MPFIPELAEVQIGAEVAWGTAVAPTAKLMGIETCKIKPINESILLSSLGSLAPGRNASLTKVAAEATIGGEALFEDLPYWFDGLLGEATPSGAGPYVYAYEAPDDTEPTPRIFTLVHGDVAGNYVYGMEGGIVSKLTISGKTGEAWKFQADLIGEQVNTDALGSLSSRTVNAIMGHMADLYIDTWAGTIGTTAISTPFFSFELMIDTKRQVYHSLGTIMGVGYREAKYEGTLKISVELDATSQAYLDAILAAAAVFQKQVRIKGSSGASLIAQLDFAGTAMKAPETFTDVDGVTTLDLELAGTYNSALGNWFEASITNGVATLP